MTHSAEHLPSATATNARAATDNGRLSSEDWHDLIVEASADGSWFYDIDSGVIHYSPRFLDILDFEPKEETLAPGEFFARIHPDDRPAYKEAFGRHLKGETEVFQAEVRVFNRSGEPTWIMNRGIARRDRAGHAYCMFGSIVDITQRKWLEESLRTVALSSMRDTSSAFFESLASYLAQALRSDFAFIGRASPGGDGRVETLAVYQDGQLVPNFEYDLEHSPCRNVVGAETCIYPDNVAARFPEDRMLADEGIEAYIGSPLLNSRGGGIGIVAALFRRPVADMAMAEDLLQIFAARAAAELERLDKERALARSEHEYRDIFNNATEGIYRTTPAGQLTRANPALVHLHGFISEDELIAALTDIATQWYVNPADRDDITRRLHQEGRVENFEVEIYRRATGERIWVNENARVVRDDGGEVVYYEGTIHDITERRRLEAEYRDIFDNVGEGIYRSTPDGRLVQANPALARLQGFDTPEALLEAVADLNRDWYLEPGKRAELLRELDENGYVNDFEAEVQRLNREGRIWTSETIRVTRDADGNVQYYEGSVRDITLEHKARTLASHRNTVLEMIARDAPVADVLHEVVAIAEEQQEHLAAAVFKLQDGHLQAMAASDLAEACFNAMNRRPPSDIGGAVYEALHGERAVVEMRLGDTGSDSGLEHAMRESEYRGVLVTPIRDQQGTVLGVLTAFATRDAALGNASRNLLQEMAQLASIAIEQHRLSEALRRQAQYDPLTGLPNRTLLSDRLQHVIEEARRTGRLVGVLLLDLDEFKIINDSLGHNAGDQLLKQVALRLGNCLRGGDTVARLGGDEFVVIVSLTDGRASCDNVAERLMESLQDKVHISGRDVNARPSIGISLFPQDGHTTEALLQAADTAMYAAKHAGKNQYRYFAESMNEQVSERLQIESGLHDALANDQLELHYQPRIELDTGALCGAEALLRWHHPERGLLNAGAFIHIAERSPLVNDIDRVVLRRAACHLAAWQRKGHDMVLSVNISARELHTEGFAAKVARKLEEAEVDASGLELEITESVLMHDFEQTRRQLTDLKERAPGLRIAIDDFGSGYSSLNYLRQLPIDTLKIDGSFVADLDCANRDTAAAIAKTIVELGRNLGLTVVGEGVETAAQAESLIRFGCHQAQGFFYDQALPAEEFEKQLIPGGTKP